MKGPSLTAITSSHAYLCTVVCAAIFTDTFLYGVVVPILPHSLASRAHLPPDQIQSLTAALLAAYGAGVFPTSIFVGYLIDQLSSHRIVLLSGLATVAASTLLLQLSSSIVLLFLGRVLQGAAAAVVWSASLAWLLQRVGHEGFTRQMSFAIMSQSVALAISPPVGGFLFDLLGYNAVFIICLVCVLAVVAMSLLVPRNEQKIDRPTEERHVGKDGVQEYVRRVDSQASLNSDGSSEPRLETAILQSEMTPLLPTPTPPPTTKGAWYATLYILTSPTILLDLFTLASVTFLWSAFAAILPLRMKLLFDSGAFGSGSVTLPLVIPTFLAGVTVKASIRFGTKWVTALLLGLRIPGTALLSLVDQDRVVDLVGFFILLSVLGLALNPIIPLITSNLLHSISKLETQHPTLFARGASGRGFGFSNCAFACGAMIGPVVASWALETAGWDVLCLGLGGFSALGFVGWIAVAEDERPKRHVEEEALARTGTALP